MDAFLIPLGLHLCPNIVWKTTFFSKKIVALLKQDFILNYKFPQEEKLKSRKLIEKLFAEGKHLKKFPLQMVYLPIDHTSESLIQASFSVSKRNFKLAVDRNRIKRQMRESYRLNKNKILENNTKKHILMFIYTSKNKLPYQEIESAMLEIFYRFNILNPIE